MNKPLLVGLTGGIGSGKTTVSKIFLSLGIPVYYADDRAKWLMANDTVLKEEIQKNFGEESYDDEGQLNRAYLAEQVFPDQERLAQLNALVHPAVGRDFAAWVDDNRHYPYLLKEAALIFEAGSYKALDKVIVVTSPKEERIRRVLLRDLQRSREQVLAIIDKQMSENERKRRANYLIDNSGKVLVIPQVMGLDKKLRILSKD